MTNNKIASFLIAGVLLLCFPASRGLRAAEHTVWQIGRFDQSSIEFNTHFNPARERTKPVFTVGKSPARDWPATR